MKSIACIVLLIGYLWSQTYISGVINGETWIPEDSPYIQEGDLIIYSLEIEPGVTFQSSMDFEFLVYGQINSAGTYQDSIYYTVIEGNDHWNGIKISDSGLSKRFEYCSISYAWGAAIQCINGSQLEIRNCSITHSELHGVELRDSNALMANCNVRENGYSGIKAQNSYLQISNSVIAENFRGMLGSQDAYIEIENCTVVDNEELGIQSNSGSNINLTNSITFYNTLESNGGDIDASYSDIEDGFDGEGNISFHPLFQEFDYYTLASISPCVDSGGQEEYYNDSCFPPSHGELRNDMGAFGGPDACNWTIPMDYDVFGCTDPIALNYNPEATSDDGSCEYTIPIYGCTYYDALNFNPEATFDDGSCLFLEGDLDGSGDLNILDVVILVETILSED